MVVSRWKARPFVLRTKSGSPGKRPTIPEGNAAVARALFGGLRSHGQRVSARSQRCDTNRAFPIRPAHDQARRVNAQSGYSMRSEFQSASIAGMSSPPLSRFSRRAGPFKLSVP